IRVSGLFAKSNPLRWSTKFTDEESGLVYYGRRYYNPSLGRWISRDPMEEDGGVNLYGFVGNQTTIAIDTLGLSLYYPGGHHIIPMQIANSLPDGPGKEYLKKYTVPTVGTHTFDKVHRAYNLAVTDYFQQWLTENKITVSDFTKSEKYARQLVSDVMDQPKNSTIGAYLGRNINGAKALKAAFILGIAFNAYSAYSSSGELIESAHSYLKSAATGDSAMIDLDAVSTAIAVQDMTGDYFTTMYVLDALLE
ncbi:MAG TPA: RHS repeat-associated core domain-containing protein, partial [Verrucomicrobiota bacterium]|nr:RHS repeat-associated core domain-containing protein [Verrucomicrobiota bacterium]